MQQPKQPLWKKWIKSFFYIFINIAGFWLMLTVAYMRMLFVTASLADRGIVHWFMKIIGLFVPIGPLAFILTQDVPWVLIVFPLILLIADYVERKYISKIGNKIIFNLLALFALTFAMDMTIFHQWMSWHSLFHYDTGGF